MIVLITGITFSTWAKLLRKKVKDGIRYRDVYATAVGDTTKAYFQFPCFISHLCYPLLAVEIAFLRLRIHLRGWPLTTAFRSELTNPTKTMGFHRLEKPQETQPLVPFRG